MLGKIEGKKEKGKGEKFVVDTYGLHRLTRSSSVVDKGRPLMYRFVLLNFSIPCWLLCVELCECGECCCDDEPDPELPEPVLLGLGGGILRIGGYDCCTEREKRRRRKNGKH